GELDRFPNSARNLKHQVGLAGIVAGHGRRLRDLAVEIGGVELEWNEAGLSRLDSPVPGPGGRAAAPGSNVGDFQQSPTGVGKRKVVSHQLARADLAKIENLGCKFNLGAGRSWRARGRFCPRQRSGSFSLRQA